MIILDERNFIVKELETHGFGIFDFFEEKETFGLKSFCELPLQRRADILLVDTETVLRSPALQENFKTLMNTYTGVFFFHEQNNRPAEQWVQDQAAFLTRIVGEFALPMPQLQWTMLSNQLQFFWTLLQDQKKLQRHMSQFSSELDQVLKSAEGEMARVRKIHHVLVPKRQDEIRGVSFFNKYATGDGGWGEFYDLHQTPNKVYHILIGSQSYLITSSLLGVLAQHKQKDFVPEAFLKDAEAEIQTINGAKKRKSEVDILVLELDLNQLTLTSHGTTKAEFYSQSRGRVNTDGPLHLSKGEKFIVFSPGFLFNWSEKSKGSLSAFLEKQKGEAQELLSELFYNIRSETRGDFLSRDATVVMMEIKRHGIHKV